VAELIAIADTDVQSSVPPLVETDEAEPSPPALVIAFDDAEVKVDS
jgi:hypothetical protein